MKKNYAVDVLEANADAKEKIGYMRTFDAGEVADRKDSLSTISIEINDIEIEKDEAVKAFKEQLKPLKTLRSKVLTDLKQNSEFIEEVCYKMIDHDSNEVGYYNGNGDLVSTRLARPNENQLNVFLKVAQ